jgi:glycosyltransferase involved in cell wall biosynthesis
MEREILQAIRATHAPHEVHILEHVSREERATILSAASLLVYPSLMEGFGFPPLEAMACGTPVIASATSSLFETVGDAGLLVDPYRIDGLAAAISALATDAGLRSRLIARGLDRVGLFTWERAAQATLSEILSVLE